MRQGLQSASTRWPVAAVLAVLALLAGAVDAGAHTPATAALGGLPRAGGLDYSPTPAGRLTPLSPAFVAQSLGLDVSALGGPSGSSAGDAGAAATSSNVVHSQTLPCVNGHQTADPLSPPCVASFSGDNGGATYHGVSRDEVRVVLRLVGGLKPRSGPLLNYAAPTETLVDLNQPPAPNEHFLVTKARLLKTYFNRHFQFYGRHLHLFVYFDGDSNQIREPDNPEHMRKLALEVLWRVNPFAVVQYDPDTTDDAGAFLDTLARAGVVGFDSVNLLPGGRFDRVSDRLWGYLPSAEQMADLFATYVCEKVVGKPVAMSGNPRDNGRPRRLGLLYPGDTRPVVYQLLTQAVRERLAACGAQVVAEAPLTPTSECGASFGLFGFPENAAEEALTVVRRFRHAGVTTVLWLGCNDHNIPVTARAGGSLPE